MSASTEDCRKFILDFQARNPRLEESRFDGELEEEGRQALLNPSNWKRVSKVRPSSQTDDHDPRHTYSVYVDGQSYNRHIEAASKVDASEIAWERRFDCRPFDGQVAYLVLERHDGTLLLGDYVGD